MENAVCIAEIDGSANPNPGPGGWGVYLEGPGIRKEIHGALAYTTNNLAEYRAFLEAVRLAKDLGIKKLLVRTDSQLVYNQFLGRWRASDSKIEQALSEVRKEIKISKVQVEIEWVRRKKNKRADDLSKKWLDKK